MEWVAISFSSARKWKVKVKSLSGVRLLVTPSTAAYQAPLSIGFSRQEYWSGVPLPSLWPGIKSRFPTLGVQSASHWTTREVPGLTCFIPLLCLYLWPSGDPTPLLRAPSLPAPLSSLLRLVCQPLRPPLHWEPFPTQAEVTWGSHVTHSVLLCVTNSTRWKAFSCRQASYSIAIPVNM